MVGFGLVRFFVCNFVSFFLSFGSNILFCTQPVTWSDRDFFGQVGSGLSGRVARDQVYHTHNLDGVELGKEIVFRKCEN